MEIIIAIIVVLAGAIWFYSRKPKDLVEAEQAEVAPYKVETVEAPAPSPVAEKATQAVVESIAPAKKPRAPRKPKAETAKPAAKKVAAKKTAGRKPKAK
jgi:hypothetical protein